MRNPKLNSSVIGYFRCPDRYVRFVPKETACQTRGYFQFGQGTVCYGGYYKGQAVFSPVVTLQDALPEVVIRDGTVYLPFDPSEIAANLRSEAYVEDGSNHIVSSAWAGFYYFIRPVLSIAARKHLQGLYLKNRKNLSFPHWPIDCSVESLHAQLLRLSLKANGVDRIPFIWFWPNGATSCAIMTHDVETSRGRDACASLMDCDDGFGIKASFQIVPEKRYAVTPEFLDSIRERGFEIAVHDLNHDGKLYEGRETFLKRAGKINSYAKEYRANGFRAGALYRRQLWADVFEFSYDMSVPNVAHLDPQRGGCCTVMPYFLGKLLELPVTTTQDYTLFHILKDYSVDLWKRQIELIMNQHGLIQIIVHPDYIMKKREQRVYEELLRHLVCLREENNIWITVPSEVNRWWRQRAAMRLVEDGNGWRIEGPGSERACIAFASEKEGQLALTPQTGRKEELLSIS